MRNPKRAMLIVGALGGCLPLATGLQAQNYPAIQTYQLAQPAVSVQPTLANQIAPLQHIPSNHAGPIDLSKYSSDVLNCAICRERLGLAPLTMKAAPPVNTNTSQPSSPATIQQGNLPASAGERMPKMGVSLGGPGLITAGAAQELEASGLVIHEFKPPTPNPDDFRLQNLPPEARQQFFQQLNLPTGARVMSAQIISGNESTPSNGLPAKQQPNTNSTKVDAKTNPVPAGGITTQTLGAPGIDSVAAPVATKPNQNQEEVKATKSSVEPVSKPQAAVPTLATTAPLPDLSKAMDDAKLRAEQMKVENLKLAEQLAIANELQQKKDRQLAEILASNKSILSEMEAAAKERDKLQALMRAQAESFEKKMAEIERSNQETSKMLEARTLEVTELQNKLQARPKSQKNKAKSDNAKNPSKNSPEDH